MTALVTETAGTSLRAALQRFVDELLDRAQHDGVRGNISGATVRRLVARDLGELLLNHLECEQ